MSEDPRCCGTGTCIINDEGVCWCGLRWDGEKMCFSQLNTSPVVQGDASQFQPLQDTPDV